MRIFLSGAFPTAKSFRKCSTALTRGLSEFKTISTTRLGRFRNWNGSKTISMKVIRYLHIVVTFHWISFLFPAIKAYTYLTSLGWVPSERQCPSCSAPMILNKRERSIDGLTWQCNKKYSKNKKKATPCGTRVSVRDGTWASKSGFETGSKYHFRHHREPVPVTLRKRGYSLETQCQYRFEKWVIS